MKQENELVKLQFIAKINKLLRAEKKAHTQVAVAKFLKISQSNLSSLYQGEARNFSIGRLVSLLRKLGFDFKITFKKL